MEEVGLGLSRMAWNVGSQFWHDWNSLEWREVGFDLTGMAWNEEVGFGLTGMAWMGESQFCTDREAWNGGCQFWPDLNSWDWQMSVLACLEWLGMSEVDFGPKGMARNRGSRFCHVWNGLERRK
jgi:hypothetical protein